MVRRLIADLRAEEAQLVRLAGRDADAVDLGVAPEGHGSGVDLHAAHEPPPF
jgi:hypothetical protein